MKQYQFAAQAYFNDFKSAALVYELVRVGRLFKKVMEDFTEDEEYSIRTLNFHMEVDEIRRYCSRLYCAKTNDPFAMLSTAIKELNGIYTQVRPNDAGYCLYQLKELLHSLENYEILMRAFGLMFEPFEAYLFDICKSFDEFLCDKNLEPLRLIDEKVV